VPLAALLCLLGVVVGGWAALPEGRAVPRDAYAALATAASAHGLSISGVEPAQWRPVPVWVAYHPQRLLRRLRGRRAGPDDEEAVRYTLVDAETRAEVTCEMQRREGAVVWIWLDGPLPEAPRIKAVRADVRAALPWVPVGAPWQ